MGAQPLWLPASPRGCPQEILHRQELDKSRSVPPESKPRGPTELPIDEREGKLPALEHERLGATKTGFTYDDVASVVAVDVESIVAVSRNFEHGFRPQRHVAPASAQTSKIAPSVELQRIRNHGAITIQRHRERKGRVQSAGAREREHGERKCERCGEDRIACPEAPPVLLGRQQEDGRDEEQDPAERNFRNDEGTEPRSLLREKCDRREKRRRQYPHSVH